jgi:hypothetical protein
MKVAELQFMSAMVTLPQLCAWAGAGTKLKLMTAAIAASAEVTYLTVGLLVFFVASDMLPKIAQARQIKYILLSNFNTL